MNLEENEGTQVTPMHVAYEEAKKDAAEIGVAVTGSELVRFPALPANMLYAACCLLACCNMNFSENPSLFFRLVLFLSPPCWMLLSSTWRTGSTPATRDLWTRSSMGYGTGIPTALGPTLGHATLLGTPRAKGAITMNLATTSNLIAVPGFRGLTAPSGGPSC